MVLEFGLHLFKPKEKRRSTSYIGGRVNELGGPKKPIHAGGTEIMSLGNKYDGTKFWHSNTLISATDRNNRTLPLHE